MATIVDAIASLVGTGWRFGGNPNPSSEQEFLSGFEVITGTAEDGSAIFSNSPTNFPVTYSQLVTERARLQSIEDSNTHQLPRKLEYPPLADFADAYYWAQNGDNTKMTAYLEAVEAVKLKYPKP